MNTEVEIITGKFCPYCGSETEHVPDTHVYKKTFGGMIYLCRPCDAYVGCHKDRPAESFGRLANDELRIYKRTAHAFFDAIWEKKLAKHRSMTKQKARDLAYTWLSKQMNIPKEYCHIGMFDIAECKQVVKLCYPYVKSKRQ